MGKVSRWQRHRSLHFFKNWEQVKWNVFYFVGGSGVRGEKDPEVWREEEFPRAQDSGLDFSVNGDGDACGESPFMMSPSFPHHSQFSPACTACFPRHPTSASSCRKAAATFAFSVLASRASAVSCCSACPLYTGCGSRC